MLVPRMMKRMKEGVFIQKSPQNTTKNEKSFLFVWYFAHLIVPLQLRCGTHVSMM